MHREGAQLLRRRVLLRDLTSRPDLNGKVGRAVAFDATKGRYTVEVERSGGVVGRVGRGGKVEKKIQMALKPEVRRRHACRLRPPCRPILPSHLLSDARAQPPPRAAEPDNGRCGRG